MPDGSARGPIYILMDYEPQELLYALLAGTNPTAKAWHPHTKLLTITTTPLEGAILSQRQKHRIPHQKYISTTPL